MKRKKKKEKICSVKRDTITARFLIQQRERDESPWREKINLMANEFLPSRAPGQLRRGVEEGPENGGMTGRTLEVSRKKVGRYARKVSTRW